MAFQKVLLENGSIAPGEEKRLLPSLDVSRWDRLHFHIGARARSIAGISVKVLFATPVTGGALLASSTVWFEESVSENEFMHITSTDYNKTGFIMSIPVVAPQLYDVILRNVGDEERSPVFVTVMAQEI